MHSFHTRITRISPRSRLPALRTCSRYFAATLAVATFAGCSRGRTETKTPVANKAAPQPDTRTTFDLRGEIVRVVVEKRLLMVHHEEIPNYMPAMTMEFKIGEADVSAFKEGQRIAAKMIDEKNGDFRLEGIRILDTAKDHAVQAAARKLKEDTFVLGKNAYREIGEAVPSFALYNQEGEVVLFDQLRGKRVILNFIFTRCPIATMCPAATARMASLQRLAAERKIPDLQLISISLDPAYDTPPVLKGYAVARGIDLSNFSFLTGPEEAVRNLLIQFGVVAEQSENILKHSLATVLIERNGKIAHRVDGSTWEPEDFLKRL